MNTQEALAAIERFSEPHVVVVGDVMLDIYEFCSTAESKVLESEKPGKRAYKEQVFHKVLGGAGNVAASLASLGVSTSLVGVTRNDEHYFNIRHYFIRDSLRPSTVKMRLYVDNDYLLRRDHESTNKIDKETSVTVLNEVLHGLKNADAIILSDYNKGVFTEDNTYQIVKECRMQNVPLIVDFKPPESCFVKGSEIMAPNQQKTVEMVSGFSLDDRLEDFVRRLHDLLQCENTVVTLGDKGVCGFDGTCFFHITGHKVKAVDTVGCGDTVRAGLALGYALGFNLRDCAVLGNDAAGVIVQKPLTAMLSREELTAFVRANHSKISAETQKSTPAS